MRYLALPRSVLKSPQLQSDSLLCGCGPQPEPPLGWLDEAEVVGYLWTDDESQAQR